MSLGRWFFGKLKQMEQGERTPYKAILLDLNLYLLRKLLSGICKFLGKKGAFRDRQWETFLFCLSFGQMLETCLLVFVQGFHEELGIVFFLSHQK
jgi:hypothetical protein